MPVANLQNAAHRTLLSSSNLISTRADVKEQNGLEVPKQLQWAKWHAGGEFVKVLCVKNVSTDVIKFSYKLLPSSSAFSVEYPEPRRLSPGMSATIKVAFRPSMRQSYTDKLELIAAGSSFAVPLSAVLPASKLQLPAAVDFGCVPVSTNHVQQLLIKNVGDAALRFSWELQQPFTVLPPTGQLAPGQSLACQVHFVPQEAAAFRVAAACSLDNGELLTVQVSGMAKFAFLSLETDCLDLGGAMVGQTVEAFVRFGNHSAVPAEFTVVAGPGSHDGTITVQPTRGTLYPNEFSMLRVLFSPKATGAFSCETFTLVTEGGNKLPLTCKGTAVAPKLHLSARVFAFGNVRCGHCPSQTLYIENGSSLPVHYQIVAGLGSVFTLARPQGVIQPHSMAHSGIKFCGSTPGNYWQRLVCIVQDGEPQAIDVLASCFDDTSRPPTLSYQHIEARLCCGVGRGALPASQRIISSRLGTHQQQNEAEGISSGHSQCAVEPGGGLHLPSSDRQRLISPRPGNDTLGQQGSDTGCEATGPSAQEVCDTFLATSQRCHQLQQLAGPDSWQALFLGLEVSLPAVTVSTTLLDFGCCSRLSPSEPQIFQVTNNTDAKIVVRMLIPAWSDPYNTKADNKAGQQVFSAFPETLELLPRSTGTMRLAFRPPKDGQYYSQTVTLLSSIKAMRSYRLVAQDQVVPPWTCAMLACGNTFANVNTELSPKVSICSTCITFPACRLGEAVHQTLCLTNQGDTPVHFAFHARGSTSNLPSRLGVAAAGALDSGAAIGSSITGGNSINAGLVAAGLAWFGTFALLPVQGVLQAKSQQLVAVRFEPVDLNPAELRLTCTFNHSSSNSMSVLLCGTASEPRLEWDVPDNRIFFRPTCVGACSTRQLTVRNAGRVAVGWQWVLSHKLKDAVSVAPTVGVLRGHESVNVTVTFAPMRQGLYSARAALLLLPPSSTSSATAAESCDVAPAQAGTRASLEEGTPVAAGLQQVTSRDLDQATQHTEEHQHISLSVPEARTLSADNADSSVSCEKLILTVVGESTQAILSIEPASLSFGVVNVGYAQRKTFQLVNQSAGVLRYHVTVHDDNPAGINTSDVACEFGGATAVLTQPTVSGCSAAAGSVAAGAEGAAADCWLDFPEGLVAARATKSVVLTLLPKRRGQYRLRLSLYAATMPQLPRAPCPFRSLSAGSAAPPASAGRLQLDTLPAPAGEQAGKAAGSVADGSSCTCSPRDTGPPFKLHGKPAACSVSRSGLGAVRLDESWGCGAGAAEAAGVGDVRKSLEAGPVLVDLGVSFAGMRPSNGMMTGPTEGVALACGSNAGTGGFEGSTYPGDAFLAATARLDRPPLATAAVAADAMFPTALFTDVYCNGIPKQVSWQVLGLSEVNRELRCPVTAAEVQAQQLAVKGQLSNSNAASLLPPLVMDLGYAAVGSRPREFWVQLSNDQVLPVEWELHSYDAPQVDLENWVEAARPMTQAEKERAFIVENNIFEVLPRHGTLSAGQHQQVCLRFNPVAEGCFSLPLFLQIKDGKQLQLQLTARSVAATAQHALAVRGSHTCQLVAAPIGELQPPLQQSILRNAGPAPLRYRLETSPLQELARQNYSAEVIKYAGGSPLAGVVQPGCVAVFNWFFQPLEPRVYSVALPLYFGDGPPQPFVIQGRGYHPTLQPELAAPTAEELSQQWQSWLGFSQHPPTAAHCQHMLQDDNSCEAPLSPKLCISSNGCSSSSSTRWLVSTPEVVDLGVSLPASSTKQLLTLANTASVPMEFAWQLGMFDEHEAVMSGRLSLVPSYGVLEPGEVRVCHVHFEAGLQAQLFSGDIYCHAVPARCASPLAGIVPGSATTAGVTPAGRAGCSQSLTLEKWQELAFEGRAPGTAATYDAADEEVIAQHPERKVQSGQGKALRRRLPLHLSMTESTCSKFDKLKQRYQRTLALHTSESCSAATQQQAQSQQEDPQLLALTVQGAVLCKAHVNAGSYIQPHELQKARKLLAVSHMLPAVAHPISLVPEPGALGPSAATARAVKAVAEQQQLDGDGAGVQQCTEARSTEAADATVEVQAVGMAGSVLELLITDMWADEKVSSAVERIPPSALPTDALHGITAEGQQSSQQSLQQALTRTAADSAVCFAGAWQSSQNSHAFAEYVLDSALLGSLQEGLTLHNGPS